MISLALPWWARRVIASAWSLSTTISVDRLSRGMKLGLTAIECGALSPYPGTLADIREALEDAGIEFIPENGGGLGVRFANQHKSSRK